MGLLDSAIDLQGLLGNSSGGLLGGRFTPSPNEGFLDKVLGTNDPRDPRGPAMMQLAAGLLRGRFADGVEGASRAFAEVEDRNARRAFANLALGKNALEIEELRRKLQEDAESRSVMQDYYRNRQPAAQPQGAALPASIGMASGAGVGMPSNPQSASMPSGAASGRNSAFENYMGLAQAYAEKGLGQKAQQYYQLAMQFRPKFSTTPQVMRDPSTNQLVNVLVGEDGTTQAMPYGVRPDIQIEDLGGVKRAIDKNATQGGEVFQKTMTPGEVASNQVALGNLRVSQGQLGLARERFNAEQNAPQYQVVEGQIYELPKRPQPGAQPVARPVTLPNGEPVGGGNPKLTEFQGKSTTFATRMRDATGVLDKLEGQAWPSTVNRAGYQAEAPSWLPGGSVVAGAATTLNNMTVPAKAQQLHQAQENWVTANLRQESGAAIGKEEMSREKLKWFPQPGDGPEVIRQKADARRVAEEAMMTQAGPGSKMIAGTLERAGQANDARRASKGASAEPLPLPSTVTASNLKKGATYRLPNGTTAQFDGFRFVEVKP